VSRLDRLAKLGKLGSRLAGSTMAQRVRGVFLTRDAELRASGRALLDNAERVAETLGQLKGAAMKVGQAIAAASVNLDLPEEVQEALSRLNDRAEPVPFSQIQRVVEAELRAPLEACFAWFDPTPLGTASLAQVHAARLFDGREVVVKVQHEGVAESVSTDLAAMKAIVIAGRLAGRDRAELDEAFAELEARLREELDYAREADNLTFFSSLYADDPRVLVPHPRRELSTARVLTMDRLAGVPLSEFVQSAAPEARQRAGHTLAELFFEMAFHHRVLHADPHPGNYLFGPDGTVGVLDFGCVKRFEGPWIDDYARAVRAALDGDRRGCLDACRACGAWVGDTPEAGDAIWEFCDTLVAPLREGSYTIGGPDDTLMERLQAPALRMWPHREIRGPRHVLFLHRTLGGLYAMTRKLTVSGEWGALIRKHTSPAPPGSMMVL